MAAKSAKISNAKQGIYVVCGKDKHLVSKRCQDLVESMLKPDERAMSLFQPDCDKVELVEVLDELRTLPFLAEKRVVVLKGADKFVSEHRAALEKYFDEPSKTGVLVLAVETWMKTTKLAKKLAKVGQLVEIGVMKAWQLPKFVTEYAIDTHGKGMARGASELVVELVGDEPGRLCSETDKLAMYVGDNKTISVKDVEALVGHNRMFNVFAVIDSLTTGDVGSAVEKLRNMFASDKSAEFSAVGAFAFHFRRMFRAKALLQKGTNRSQVAKQLRIWGNEAAFFAQVGKLSLARIGAVIGELARIDHGMKTGGMTGKVAIEQLIFKLGMMTGRRR
ncbi:MAG: DNA polymerase III subunit delta [Anaerohalosphaera sp.]|nr:DNA polymerase III subunit delta [Anaerohalosphaera sp.]